MKDLIFLFDLKLPSITFNFRFKAFFVKRPFPLRANIVVSIFSCDNPDANFNT